MESIYQNDDELDEAVADLSETFVTYESVYTEIGMKFGARIIFHLLHKDDLTEFNEANPKSTQKKRHTKSCRKFSAPIDKYKNIMSSDFFLK